MTQSAKEMTPEVFISHRLEDKNIAEIVSDFIRRATDSKVRAFCSFDGQGQGLPVGENLTQALAEHLKVCSVVLLIFTRSDDDWMYCMWECGVAYDPEKALEPDKLGATRIAVLKFSSTAPAPLRDRVCVDARSVDGIHQFVRQLLTDAKFFPGYGKKVTGFSEDDKEVKEYGKELYENLVQYQRSSGSVDKRTVVPRMTIELDFKQEIKVKSDTDTAIETVRRFASVRDIDEHTLLLFNVTSAEGRSLGHLFNEWRRANPGSDEMWFDFLITQIIDVINDRRVDPNWESLRTKDRKGVFVPIVLSFLRVPHKHKLYIKVCFPEFYKTLHVSNEDYRREPKTTETKECNINPAVRSDFKEVVTGARFLWIEGNRFSMGSDKIEPGAYASPSHDVQISSFWIAETPVTRREYQIYMEQTAAKQPNYWMDDRFSDPLQPVVGISWDDAMGFCSWLADKTGLDVRLPTEAQWEFAARGPTGYRYPWGDAPPGSSRACFARDEQYGRPCPVGSFKDGKGPFGTLDQSGNVWEWCRDEWDECAYQKRGVYTKDPLVKGIISTNWRALRGGGWDNAGEETKYLMSAYRMANIKSIQHWAHGFRIVVVQKES